MIGIILAGGLASRLGGGDKGLLAVGGRPILARVVATLRGQCDGLVVSANGDTARFGPLGLPVVADTIARHSGPLAGVLAGLDWIAAHHPEAAHAVSAPADTPFLPADLVARLEATRRQTGAAIVCARSGGKSHPVAALWSVALREDLRTALAEEGLRKVHLYLERHAVAYADWASEPYDPFFNVNTPEDIAAANLLAGRVEAGGGRVWTKADPAV